MDRLEQITYPGGTVINITPNVYGEPESVGSYASGIDYWPNGSIKALDYGTQQGTGRKYATTQNARQLPAELKVVLGSTNLARLTHSYDANANVKFIDDAVHGSSYDRSMVYDDLDRLETANGWWGTGSYSYDVLGNLKTKTEIGSLPGDIDLSYSYNATTNLLSSVNDAIGSADYTFSYDNYGNVSAYGGQTFTYNLAGNMVSSTNPDIGYQYDGHKRRVQKTEGGQTSFTMYGQNGKLMHKLKGGVSSHYIYAGSLLIAELQGSTVNYLHTDLLGSPIRGDNGTAYGELYRPWGEKKDHPVQLADDVGYTGHQDDVATGLTYMQARYYDPVIGRFMAVDPIGFSTTGPMSFNRYTYVNDNPYRYTDPTGNSAVAASVERSNERCEDDPNCTVIFSGGGSSSREDYCESLKMGCSDDSTLKAAAAARNVAELGSDVSDVLNSLAIDPATYLAGPAIVALTRSGKLANFVRNVLNGRKLRPFDKIGKPSSRTSARGVREETGGVDDARELFESRRVGPINEVRRGVFISRDVSGGVVTFRPFSKSGGAAVDVHPAINGVRRIHYVTD